MAMTYEDRLIRRTVADRPDCPFLSRSRSRRAWRLHRSGPPHSQCCSGLKTDRVLSPVSSIAIFSGTPARTKCLTAVRLKSCGIRSGQPATSHARRHAFRNDPIRPRGSPPRSRWNTHGLRIPCVRSASCVAHCVSIASRSCGNRWPYGNVRPSSFFVWPGSSRTIPTVRSICRHCNTKTSLGTRQPVRYANVTTDRRAAGRAVRTASNSSRSKNPVRPLCSRSIGICGRWRTLCASAASVNMRLSTASSRLIVALAAPSVGFYPPVSGQAIGYDIAKLAIAASVVLIIYRGIRPKTKRSSVSSN